MFAHLPKDNVYYSTLFLFSDYLLIGKALVDSDSAISMLLFIRIYQECITVYIRHFVYSCAYNMQAAVIGSASASVTQNRPSKIVWNLYRMALYMTMMSISPFSHKQGCGRPLRQAARRIHVNRTIPSLRLSDNQLR
jgi:hypothetical protein